MRVSPLRRGLPLVVLLLAVFVQAALGPVLACPVVGPERPVALAAVAEPVPAHDSCPGCLPESLTGGERAESSESPPLLTGWNPCSSGVPCQHGPSGDDGTGDEALRASDAPRDPGPAVLPVRLSSDVHRRQGPPGVDPVPPRPALVTVLCVDRS